MKKKSAVVLLSGGLDSATVLFYAKQKGYKPSALIFDYGQRHKKEITCAKALARYAKVPFRVVKIEFPWKGSALIDKSIQVPLRRHLQPSVENNIPPTYVPSRNTIFLSFAASFAEAIGARTIFIGANAIDYSGYPDCRAPYFRLFEKTLAQGTKTGVLGKAISIKTPLIKKTKAQIIRLGLVLGVPYHLTWSCYCGGKKPCGGCDSCLLRRKGFEEIKCKDPLLA